MHSNELEMISMKDNQQTEELLYRRKAREVIAFESQRRDHLQTKEARGETCKARPRLSIGYDESPTNYIHANKASQIQQDSGQAGLGPGRPFGTDTLLDHMSIPMCSVHKPGPEPG